VLIKPEDGKKYDDFQLTYAVEVLDGKVKSGVVASRDMPPAPRKDQH
jgi:hypothetical protein